MRRAWCMSSSSCQRMPQLMYTRYGLEVCRTNTEPLKGGTGTFCSPNFCMNFHIFVMYVTASGYSTVEVCVFYNVQRSSTCGRKAVRKKKINQTDKHSQRTTPNTTSRSTTTCRWGYNYQVLKGVCNGRISIAVLTPTSWVHKCIRMKSKVLPLIFCVVTIVLVALALSLCFNPYVVQGIDRLLLIAPCCPATERNQIIQDGNNPFGGFSDTFVWSLMKVVWFYFGVDDCCHICKRYQKVRCHVRYVAYEEQTSSKKSMHACVINATWI